MGNNKFEPRHPAGAVRNESRQRYADRRGNGGAHLMDQPMKDKLQELHGRVVSQRETRTPLGCAKRNSTDEILREAPKDAHHARRLLARAKAVVKDIQAQLDETAAVRTADGTMGDPDYILWRDRALGAQRLCRLKASELEIYINQHRAQAMESAALEKIKALVKDHLSMQASSEEIVQALVKFAGDWHLDTHG